MAVCHPITARLILAVGYLRRSSDKQEASIPQQRKAIESYADSHGYKIIRWYIDDAISGDDTEKRLDFRRMIGDAETIGDFKAVLCWDQDRFGRFDSIEAGRWIHPLRQAGVHLATVAQGKIDWSDFTGRMMYGIVQEGKHQFLRDLSRNATRGLIAKAQRGEWPAGSPPRGYSTDENGRLILGDHTDVDMVRRIYALYLGGMSLQVLVDTLNREGTKWYRSTVRGILINPIYCGDFVWNTRCQSKYNGIRGGEVSSEFQRGHTDESDWIRLRDNHPPIIERATFDAVQRRLTERNSANGKGASSPRPDKFALTGLLHCEKCGSRMYGHTVSGFDYFVCGGYLNHGKSFCDRNGVRQEQILETIIAAIEAEYLNPAVVKRLREELHRQVKQSTSKVSAEHLRQQIGTVDQQLDKAKRRLVEVDHDMLVVVQDQIRELQGKREALNATLQAAATPVKRLLADADSKVDAAMKAFGRLRETLQRADMPSLREYLRQAVESVVLAVDHTVVGKRKRFELSGGEIRLQGFNLYGSPRSTLV